MYDVRLNEQAAAIKCETMEMTTPATITNVHGFWAERVSGKIIS